MQLKSLITLLDTAMAANKRILPSRPAMIFQQLCILLPLLCQFQRMFTAPPVVSSTSIFHLSPLCFSEWEFNQPDTLTCFELKNILVVYLQVRLNSD